MTNQKSKSEYQNNIQLSEAPLPKTLEVCIWFENKECEKSGLRVNLGDRVYNGKSCKCFAYIPKQAGDYQI